MQCNTLIIILSYCKFNSAILISLIEDNCSYITAPIFSLTFLNKSLSIKNGQEIFFSIDKTPFDVIYLESCIYLEYRQPFHTYVAKGS